MISQPTNRRDKKLEYKYLNDIAQLVNLPVEKVEEVFRYYTLYLLHEIATTPEPKETIKIDLPCFCSLLLKPKDDKLQITLRPETRDYHIKDVLEQAYFKNKDFLLEHLVELYSKRMQTEIQDIIEKDIMNGGREG